MNPQRLAVEPAEVLGKQEDDVWVGSGGLRDEFSPAYEVTPPEVPNHFVESLAGEVGAIERTTGELYAGPHVAVDNNPETDLADHSHCTLAGCVHYLSTAGANGGIEKLNARDEPVAFTCTSAECPFVGEGTVKGVLSRIAYSPPAGPDCQFGGSAGDPGAVAVDSAGDIYVVFDSCNSVLEFQPSGAYLRAFEMQVAPRIGPEKKIGEPASVAVDEVSGHLLVSVATFTGSGAERVGVIEEFETEGTEAGKFVDELTEAGEPGEGVALGRPQDVAVDSRGDVYVADEQQRVVDVWGPGAYYPTVTVGVASERTGESAVLTGSVDPAQHGNPEPAAVTECYFQYVDEAEYQRALGKEEEEGFEHSAKVSCEPPEIHAGLEERHPVVATLVHLSAGVTYQYRLVATTEKAKKGGTERSKARAFTAPAKPEVSSTSAGDLSSTFADLEAKIDPLGADTTYHFEYDTREYKQGEESHGTSAPVPDADIGSGGATGSSQESVSRPVASLTPGTTYYFRVLATNEVGTTPGTDETFRTLPAATTSERGYELVTPADKQGGSDMFEEPQVNGEFNNDSVGVPAQSGEGFLLETKSGFGPFPFVAGAAYVFHREPEQSGWGYISLAPPSLGVQGFGGALVEPEGLSAVALNDNVGAALGEEGSKMTDLIGPPGAPALCRGATALEEALMGGCYINLHQDPPGGAGGAEVATSFVGASHDLEHVVLESGSNSVCPGPEGAAGKVKHGHLLCEWAGGYETHEGERRPELTLVNEKEGEPVSACGAALGNTFEGQVRGSAFRAVSADGSRVLFTAPDPQATRTGTGAEGEEGCWDRGAEEHGAPPQNAPQLYDRVQTAGPPGEDHETIELSTPHEEGVPVPPADERYPAHYAGASEDGSRVFFATRSELTGEAVALHLHDMELYEWRADGVAGPGGVCAEGEGCLTRASAGMEGEPGRDQGAAVTNMSAVAAEGTAVYFFAQQALAPGGTSSTEGLGQVYRYDTETGVTSFVAATGEHKTNSQFSCPELVGAPCSVGNWYTTPDGEFLLFDGPHGLQRYDASTGATTLIAGPQAHFARSATYGDADGPVTAMSDNGEYVFFDSPEALVLQATNSTLDTYEWHENPATHVGTISLIGSGSDPAPTWFLGYAPYEYTPAGSAKAVKVEGGNVFIGTHARLTPQDTNSVGDIYDARICEPESPCIQPPPGETAICEGGSCQTPPAEPIDATPVTLTPSGVGNLASEPPMQKVAVKTVKCRQGFVKKKVKKKQVCVKKPKPKKRAKKASRNRRVK